METKNLIIVGFSWSLLKDVENTKSYGHFDGFRTAPSALLHCLSWFIVDLLVVNVEFDNASEAHNLQPSKGGHLHTVPYHSISVLANSLQSIGYV